MRQRGFTLIEIALVLVVVGIVLGLSASMAPRILDGRRVEASVTKLEGAEAALIAFVGERGRLPCPASATADDGQEQLAADGSCTTQVRGVLPWRTMGVSRDTGVDGHGNLVSYRVHDDASTGLTRDFGLDMVDCDPAGQADVTTGTNYCASVAVTGSLDNYTSPENYVLNKGLVVCSAAACGATQVIRDPATATGAAFVLISHGENGLGAVTAGGVTLGTATPTDEAPNSGANGLNAAGSGPAGGTGYVQARFLDRDNGAAHYDDLVRAPTILEVATRAGRGPTRHDIQTSSDSSDTGTPDDFDLNTDPNGMVTVGSQANVLGSDGGAPLTDGRNVLNFGTGNAGEGSDPGDMSGSTTNCAWVSESFNLTTQTLRIYFKARMANQSDRNSATGNGDGFTTTIIPGTTTVSSAGPCGGYGEFLAYGPRNGANIDAPKMAVEVDTYRNGNQGDPARNHAAVLRKDTGVASSDDVQHGGLSNPACPNTPSANGSSGACTYDTNSTAWLEDNVAHPVRIDIKRRCNSDCSTCTVDNTTFAAASATYPNVRVRAWFDCSHDDCDDLTKDGTVAMNTNTARTVNWCGSDPGGSSFSNQFATVHVGWTTSTGGARSAIQFTDITVKAQ